MKLIRWLLSNIILIVIVLALSYSYVYWDNLTGQDTPAGEAMAWASEEFEEIGELLAYLKVTKDEPRASEQSAENETPEVVAEVTPPAPAVEQSVAMPPDQYVTPESAEDQYVTPESTEDRYVTPEIEQSLSNIIDEGTVTTAPETEALSSRELWINARKSFHRRDFESSISSYEQLISKTPDNFDAYGELGNVYFNQGEMKQAAASYYEAAVILVRLGQLQRANSLVGMLDSMDHDKAKELQALISSARS